MHAFFPNKNFKSAGILHLGNVIFSEASSNSEEAKVHIEESKIDHQNFQVNACIFSLMDFFVGLSYPSFLFGIGGDQLAEKLTTRMISVRKAYNMYTFGVT